MAQGPQGSSSHVFIYFYILMMHSNHVFTCSPLSPSFPHQKRKSLDRVEVHNIPPPQVSELVPHPTSYITHHMCCIYTSTSLGGVVGGDGCWSFSQQRVGEKKSLKKTTRERERL
jgi:hypothetical protein